MSYLTNPRHWRDRLDEIRAKAEELWYAPEEVRQRLQRIAQEYDLLADQAAERLRLDEWLEANLLRQPER
jgi:hypothetical protein